MVYFTCSDLNYPLFKREAVSSIMLLSPLLIEVSLSFAEESYTVDEDAGFVTFCLELSGVSDPTQTLIVVQVDSDEDGAGKLHLT